MDKIKRKSNYDRREKAKKIAISKQNRKYRRGAK